MYKTIITIKDNLPHDTFVLVSNAIANAFNNRAGNLANISNQQNVFVFEGEEKNYGCLDLGVMSLQKKGVLENIKTMYWIDEEPNESYEMLAVFAKYS